MKVLITEIVSWWSKIIDDYEAPLFKDKGVAYVTVIGDAREGQ